MFVILNSTTSLIIHRAAIIARDFCGRAIGVFQFSGNKIT